MKHFALIFCYIPKFSECVPEWQVLWKNIEMDIVSKQVLWKSYSAYLLF